jgi:hypothetical protein
VIPLTAFKAAKGLAVQILVTIQGSHELPALVLAKLPRKRVGHPPENLRHGRLRDAQLRGDLALRPGGGIELPGALGARLDDGPRLVTSDPAAGLATAGLHRDDSSTAGAPTLRTVPFV